LAADEVLLDDLGRVLRLDAGVPRPLRVDDDHGPVEARPKAARDGDADGLPELLVRAERLLERVVDLRPAARAARRLGVRRPLRAADEEVARELRVRAGHRRLARARSIAVSIIFWCWRGSAQRARPSSGSASMGSK